MTFYRVNCSFRKCMTPRYVGAGGRCKWANARGGGGGGGSGRGISPPPNLHPPPPQSF